jgi:uncharacterized protein
MPKRQIVSKGLDARERPVPLYSADGSSLVHNEAALDVLRWSLRGGLIVDGAPQEALVTVLTISERFADLPFDLADASIAEAAERLRIRQILSIDADFDIYRDQKGRSLINVLRH